MTKCQSHGVTKVAKSAAELFELRSSSKRSTYLSKAKFSHLSLLFKMNLQGNETDPTNGPIAPHNTCNNKTTLKLGKNDGATSQHEYAVLMPQSLMADIIRFPGHKYNIIFKEHMDNVILELSRCTIDTQIYTGLSLAACDKLRCENHNDKCCSYTFADSLYASHRQIDETRRLLNRAKFKARHYSLQTGRFYNFAGGYNPWDLYDSAVSDMLNIPRAITKGNRIFGAPEISKQANTYIGGPLSREQIELTLVMARMMERLNTTMRPLFLHCDTSWARVCQALENWSLDAALYLNKRHALYEQHMAISLVITDILWSINILEERILLKTNENDMLIKSLIMARRERLIHYQHSYKNGQLADHMKEHPVCFREQLLSSVDGVCATYGPSVNSDKTEHLEYMRKHQNRTTAMELIHEDIVRKKAWAIKMGLAKASNWMEPGRYITFMETKLVSLKDVPHIVVHTMYQHKGFALSPKAMNRYKDNMVSGKGYGLTTY